MTQEELNNLTPEQKNARIADLIGGPKYHAPAPEEIASGSYYQYKPNFVSDLNTMHEAEKMLTPEQRQRYMNALCLADPNKGSTSWYYLTLTAAQRAEAFLLTIG